MIFNNILKGMKRMKLAIHGVFLVLLSVLQTTWLDGIAVWGIKPDLFVVYVTTIACFCGKREAAVSGVIFGIVLDILTGKLLGLNAVLLMLLGFTVAHFCDKVIRKSSVFIVMLITFIVSFFYELIYLLIAFAGSLNIKAVFLRALLPECIYNAVAVAPFYWVIKKLARRLWTDKGEGIG